MLASTRVRVLIADLSNKAIGLNQMVSRSTGKWKATDIQHYAAAIEAMVIELEQTIDEVLNTDK
jgi:hypothetical protein